MERMIIVSARVFEEIIDTVGGNPALTYMALIGHRNGRTGECFITHEHLAEELKVTRKTVISNLNRLKKYGFIDWIQGGSFSSKANQYIFLKEYASDEDQHKKEMKKAGNKKVQERAKAKRAREKEDVEIEAPKNVTSFPTPTPNMANMPAPKSVVSPKFISAVATMAPPAPPMHLRQTTCEPVQPTAPSNMTTQDNTPKVTTQDNKSTDTTQKTSNKDYQAINENKKLVKRINEAIAFQNSYAGNNVEAHWKHDFTRNSALLKKKEYDKANELLVLELEMLEESVERMRKSIVEYQNVIDRLNSSECDDMVVNFKNDIMNSAINKKRLPSELHSTIDAVLRMCKNKKIA